MLKGHVRGRALRRSAAARRDHGPAHLGASSASGCSAISRRASPRGPRWRWAAGVRRRLFDKGLCVEPTLFTDVDNSMTIAQEEIFGPVLVVIPFEDEDDAVRIANDSKYGLSGGVFSGSVERSLAVARRIRTGGLSINGGAPYGADCRSAATNTAGSAARTASPGSSSTSRSSPWRGRQHERKELDVTVTSPRTSTTTPTTSRSTPIRTRSGSGCATRRLSTTTRSTTSTR